MQPMNEWYSFHLYFYLIGVLWILFYDIICKYSLLSKKSLKSLFNDNKWTVIILTISILWIFSFQIVSNLAQWRRGPYIHQWLETKREAMLFPTDESLPSLLWEKQDTIRAIATLKKYKLSVFREDIPVEKIMKLSGWNSDGWISRNARMRIMSGQQGILSMSIYVPPDIFLKDYKSSFLLIISNGGKLLVEHSYNKGSFDGGPVTISINIPRNELLNIELILNKSFVPAKVNDSKDMRELGVLIDNIKVY